MSATDYILTPIAFRALEPEELILQQVIKQAFYDAGHGNGSGLAAAWFRGREYRATCLVLGLSQVAIERIRNAATERYERTIKPTSGPKQGPHGNTGRRHSEESKRKRAETMAAAKHR